MRKLLAFLSVFLLLNSSFGQDVGATFLQTPSTFATICPDPAQSIDVVITNFDPVSIFDFSVNNVRVTVNITGASTQTITHDVTSGVIPNGGTFLVSFTSTCDLSAIGTHVFSYSTSILTGGPDVNAANDAGGPVNVQVQQPAISLTSAGGTDAQSLCTGVAITDITYSVSGSASGASNVGDAFPTGINGSYAGGVYTISGTPTQSGTFNYDILTSGGACTPHVNATGTITVADSPTSDAGLDASICTGETFTADATATIGTILWTTSGDGAFDDATLEDPTYTPGAADLIAGTVDLTMTVSSAGCADAVDVMTLTINNTPPTSDAGVDATVCEGNTHTLAATAANGTNLWTTSGDGTFDDATLEDPTYTPGAADITAGTVDLTLTVSNAPCADAIDVMTLTIDGTPLSDAGIDATICTGETYTAIATATNAGSILWSTSGDGTFDDATLEASTYTPGAADIVAGTVDLTMTVSNGSCLDAVDVMTLTINNTPPTSDAGLDDSVCEGDTYTLAATSSNGTNLWTTSGDGTFDDATLEDPTYTPGATDITAGSVDLTLTVSNAPCADAIDVMTLTIDGAPLSDAGIDATVCTGDTYTAIATATNAGSILWSTSGDGTFDDATLEASTYTPGAADIVAGTVDLTMTVSNGSCLDAVDVMTLTINNTPPTSDAGLDASVCEGDTYTLVATSTNGTNLWTTSGDGTFADATLEDAVYTPGAGDITGGTVDLTLTVSDGVCVDALDVMTLTIDGAPIADAGGPTASVCEGDTYTAAATATNASSILWTTSGDGTFDDATLEDPTYTPGAGDIAGGTVTLTMTVSNGVCVDDVDAVVITINALPSYTINSTNPSACGATDGEITISVLNITTNYDVTYDLNAAPTVNPTDLTDGAGVLTISGLGAGSYTNFIVTETSTSCSTPDIAGVSLTNPGSPDVDDILDQVLCDVDGGYTLPVITGTNLTGSEAYYTLTGGPSGGGVVIPVGTVINSTSTIFIYDELGACTDEENFSVTINASPTADAGLVTDNICETDTYTLAATATNGTIAWTTSGDGTFDDATIEDPIYTPGAADLTAGTVTLTMTVSNAPCVDATDNIVITINAAPTADAGLVTDVICQTGAYTLDATSSNGTNLWTTSGDGTFDDATLEDPVYTPGVADITAGTVDLTLTVSNAFCVDATDLITLTINGTPTADAGLATDDICETDTYTLAATATNGTIAWSTSGDGTFDDATLEDPTYTPGAADITAGTVTLTMTVSNAPCVDATDNIVVTINAAPTADAGLATDVICQTSSYTLAATSTNGANLWTTSGDGTFDDATLEDPTYAPGAGDITAGTVDLTLTVSNAFCVDATDLITLTINGTPTADAGLVSDDICEGAPYTLAATSTNGTNLWTTSGDGTFDDATLEDPTYTPGAADIVGGTVTLTMTVSNAPCVDATDNIVLTINSAPTADAGLASESICVGDIYTATATATNGTVLWTTSGSGSFTNATVEDVIYTPSVADETAGFVNLTMTVSNAFCSDAVDNVILTINPLPTFTVNATSNPSGCGLLDGAITLSGLNVSTNYNISYDDNGSTVALGVVSTDPSGDYLISGLGSGSYTNFVVTLSSSSCSATDFAGTNLLVPGSPDVDDIVDQVLCDVDGGYILPIITGTNLTGGEAYYSAANGVGPAIAPGTNINSTQTIYIYDVDGGGCFDQEIFDVTVNPSPTADAGLATDNMCETGTYTAAATATNTTSITWTSSGTGVFTNPNIEDAEYTPSAADIIAGTFTLTMTVANSPCVNATDNVIVTINAAPTADAGLATDVICQTGTYTLDATSSNGTNLWTTSGDGTFDDATLEDPTYTPGAGDITAGTVDLTLTVSNAFCVDATDLITLTINASPTSDAGLATDDICETDTYTLSATATNGTIAWTTSGDGTFDDATIEDPIYTPGAADLTAGTVTLTMTVSNAPCVDATDNIVVTINAAPTADAGLVTDVICQTGTYTLDATSSNGTNLWTTSGDGTFDDATLEDPVYTPGVADITAGTVDLTLTVSNAFCVDATDLITLTINGTPTADAGLATDDICETDTYTLAATATNGTIAWSTSGDGTFDDATLEDPTYTPGAADITAGTVTLTMTVSNTPCVDATDNIVVTINAAPTADAGLPTDVICENSTYSLNASSSNGTNLWTTSGDGTFDDATLEDPVYTPGVADIAAGTVDLTMTVSNAFCTDVVDVLTLNITPLPVIADYTGVTTICSGVAFNDAPVNVLPDVVPATTVYDWAAPSGVDLPAGITGELPGVTQGDINGNLTNTTNGTLAVVYTVTPSNLGCPGADFRYTVNVYPETTIALTAGSLAQAVCNGNAFVQNDYTVGGTATGVSMTTGSLPSGLSGAFNAGIYSITGNPTQSGTFPFELTTTGSSCTEAILLDTIFVLQDTVYLSSASYTNDQQICLGDAIDQIEYTTSTGATGVVVNGLPSGYTTSYDALTGLFTIDWTPGPTEAGTYIYTVTTTGPCSGAYQQGTITVNTPIDHLNNTAGSAVTICEGTSTTLIGGTILGGNSTKTYLWESSLTSGGPFTPAFGINTNADYITDTLVVDTYFRRTVTSGGCSDISEEVLVSIDALPTISGSGGSATICSNESATIIGFVPSNATTYSWSHNGNGNLTNSTGLLNDYNAVEADAGNTVTVKLIAYGSNSCTSDTVEGTFYVNVNPLPTASISDLTGDVCPNDSITVLGASAANGTILWTSNGTGTFDDATIVAPTYTPGLTDAGSNVVLTMTVTSTVACVPAIAPSVNYVVSVKPLPIQALNAGLDDTLSIGSSVELNPTGSGIVSWEWSPIDGLDNPFIMNPIASPTATTDYQLRATDLNGCVNVDSVNIEVENDFELAISNLLTPNGDGKNDTWGIGNLEFYSNTKVIIVNRDGQIIYEDDNYANTWDGTYEGKLLPDATYYYIITSPDSGKVYKGSITILSGSSK